MNEDLSADYKIYSETITVGKGEGKTNLYEGHDGKIMHTGETYYLSLQNLNYTRDYRNAVGSFGWL